MASQDSKGKKGTYKPPAGGSRKATPPRPGPTRRGGQRAGALATERKNPLKPVTTGPKSVPIPEAKTKLDPKPWAAGGVDKKWWRSLTPAQQRKIARGPGIKA